MSHLSVRKVRENSKMVGAAKRGDHESTAAITATVKA
jgi:hypothetical protein